MHGRHSHVCPLSFLSFHTNRAGSHMRRCPQACIKTPSTILHTNPAPCQRFALLCQPPAQLAQAVQLRFKMASCQQKRRRAYGSFQISLIQTLWLQMGGRRTPNPPNSRPQSPPPLFFSPGAAAGLSKVGGGLSSLVKVQNRNEQTRGRVQDARM